ncbi:hypothetical protein Tco_1377560 [Tanacetum coccineum]
MLSVRRTQCTQSVCALRTQLVMHPVCALRTQPVCALRTQPVCALRTQPVCALRTQPVCALRTQPVCALRTQPSAFTDGTQTKGMFAVKLVSYCVDPDDRLCKSYYDTCDTLPLKIEDALVGKTLEHNQT